MWSVVKMSKNQNKWSEVANLVLNPRSKDVKLDTYSSLILDVLYYGKDKQFNLNEISEGIQRKFALANISPLILEDTLEFLISKKTINNKNSNYSITEQTFKIMKTEKIKIGNIYKTLLNSLGNEVSEILNLKLDKYQLYSIRNAFEKSLFEIFENMSQNALNFLNKTNSPTSILQLQGIIKKMQKKSKNQLLKMRKK